MSIAFDDSGFTSQPAFERTLGVGEVIFDEGDKGEVLYVIQAGEVELTRDLPAGRRLVGRLGPGEFFGEMSVVLGGTRRVRATAATSARVLELDAATFQNLCIDRPEVAIRIIQRLAGRVIDLETRLATLGSDDLLRPMVRVLLRVAAPEPGGRARISTTLRELSEGSGLSMRESHRAIHQLFDQKVMRLVDGILEVADVDALSASLETSDPDCAR